MVNAETLATGRKILRKAYFVEADKIEAQYKWLVQTHEHTTQTKELYKQLKGFSMATDTGDGALVSYEDLAALYTLTLEPTIVTKGVRLSPKMKYTDQYGIVSQITPMLAQSHEHKKNQVTANLHNLGFTSTTYGVNGETLYATAHDMGGQTFSNRATAGAFGPNTAKAAIVAVRKQANPHGEPMPYSGKILTMLPPELEPTGIEVIKSLQLSDTANNNTNEFLRNRLEMKICDYFTSAVAHFYVATTYHVKGTIFLDQMPYDIARLPQRDEDLLWPWASSSSFTVGWMDAHGTYGNPGV